MIKTIITVQYYNTKFTFTHKPKILNKLPVVGGSTTCFSQGQKKVALVSEKTIGSWQC